MTRREYLKNIAVTGGLMTLGFGVSECSMLQGSGFFSRKEQKLLASIADTIIPGGEEENAIGALDMGVDVFLEKLIEKCYEKEAQDNVKLQLAALDQSAKDTFGSRFAKCEQAQREELLLALSNSKVEAEKEFFDLMKSETIRGFRTSREVLTNYLEYEVAPGHFYGCVEVNAVF